MTLTVLLVGATGMFGGRIAHHLLEGDLADAASLGRATGAWT